MSGRAWWPQQADEELKNDNKERRIGADNLPPGTYCSKTASFGKARSTPLDEMDQVRSESNAATLFAKAKPHSTMGNCCRRPRWLTPGKNSRRCRAASVAHLSPISTLPVCATMVQAQLVGNVAFAFDVQAVCAGLSMALANANRAYCFRASGPRARSIGFRDFSKIMDWTDPAPSVLFGERCCAILLRAQTGEGTSDDRGVLSIDLNS